MLSFPSPNLIIPGLKESALEFNFDHDLNEDQDEILRDLERIHDFDSNTQEQSTFDLNIWPNLECGSGGGGHVVLGRNGAGKTLLSRSLVHSGTDNSDCDDSHDSGDNPFIHSGNLSINKRNSNNTNRNQHFLSHVSFESHSNLLQQTNTTTVHRALIPSGGNRLSPTAKFLSVRLGMYPLLPRFVNTLSTGEIRRVLLVRALVSKPELLVLDNAFDGLDVKGRKGLQDIIERVLQGFRMDILVQGVGEARDTARTQVLLLTHRPEEIAEGMGRVTFIDRQSGGRIRTEDRMGRVGDELVKSLMHWEEDDSSDEYARAHASLIDDGLAREDMSPNAASCPWELISKDDFPSNADISNFWEHGRPRRSDAPNTKESDLLIEAKNLQVMRDETILLSNLDWTVHRGEKWHLAGINGSGKSTLSRLLVRMSLFDTNTSHLNAGISFNDNEHDAIVSDGSLVVTPSMSHEITKPKSKRGGLGWVSTELHLHAAHNWGDRTVLDFLTSGISPEKDGSWKVEADIAITAAGWLGLLKDSSLQSNNHPFLSRSFSTLSQGEQKLLLIASAIAQRPSLLVLDEPCQGLDLWNRGHVLGLVERICLATDMSLVYVTHHNEELIPSIKQRLSLEDGKVAYCGPM